MFRWFTGLRVAIRSVIRRKRVEDELEQGFDTTWNVRFTRNGVEVCRRKRRDTPRFAQWDRLPKALRNAAT